MRRRHVLLSVGLMALIVGVTVGSVTYMARHEPVYYLNLAMTEGPQREQHSDQFEQQGVSLLNAIGNREPTWSTTFTQDQLNGYLQQDFERSGGLETLAEHGFSDPRVSIDPERIRIALRYGNGMWRTVVGLEVKLWLTQAEPNVVALELIGLKAGSLPLPPHWLLDAITEAAHEYNIEVNWHRHDGHPVALLRFQADQLRPSVQLQRVQVEPGRIYIAGRSLTSVGLSAEESEAE